MSQYAPPIERLIKELARFPGIGEKTAARLANFILHESTADARRLAESIMEVKDRIHLCRTCFNLTEQDLCAICANPARDREVICMVTMLCSPAHKSQQYQTIINRNNGKVKICRGVLNLQ